MTNSINCKHTTVCKWNAEEGVIHLYKKKNNTVFFHILLKSGLIRKIDEVVSDIPLGDLTLLKKGELARQTRAHLVRLSDDSYKLYLNLMLLGGMMLSKAERTSAKEKKLAEALGIDREPEEVIAERITRNLETSRSDYVSSVSVRRVEAYFGASPEKIVARKITLGITYGVGIVRLFQGIFASLPFSPGGEKFKGITNENSLCLAILGSQEERHVSSLCDAYAKGRTLTLIISNDLNHIDIQIHKGSGEKIYNWSDGITHDTDCIIL